MQDTKKLTKVTDDSIETSTNTTNTTSSFNSIKSSIRNTMASGEVTPTLITTKATEFVLTVEAELPDVFRSTTVVDNSGSTTGNDDREINIKTSTWR